MASWPLIGCSVKLEMNLVVAADKTDGENRPIGTVRKAVLDPSREAQSKKRVIGRSGVAPVCGQIEFGTDSVGRRDDLRRQWLRLYQTPCFEPGKDVHIASRCAANQTKREQGRTATNHKVARRMTAACQNLAEEAKSASQGILSKMVHLNI